MLNHKDICEIFDVDQEYFSHISNNHCLYVKGLAISDAADIVNFIDTLIWSACYFPQSENEACEICASHVKNYGLNLVNKYTNHTVYWNTILDRLKDKGFTLTFNSTGRVCDTDLSTLFNITRH